MKVTLAYDYDGQKADTTVDLDYSEATNLIIRGLARPADKNKKG